MYRLAIALVLGSTTPAIADEIRWPDPEIRVPPLIHDFIVRECVTARGNPVETVSECVEAERFGYRAVVAMLMDDEIGERAAERYRECRAGLGAIGGRFHRRRAACIGKPLGIAWRFEYARKAALDNRVILKAGAEASEPGVWR